MFYYQLTKSASVACRIFDATGRLVRILDACQQTAGQKVLSWDRRDDQGRTVSPGIYVVRLIVGTSVLQDKAVVLE